AKRLFLVIGDAVRFGVPVAMEHDQGDDENRGENGLAGFLDRAVEQFGIPQPTVRIELKRVSEKNPLCFQQHERLVRFRVDQTLFDEDGRIGTPALQLAVHCSTRVRSSNDAVMTSTPCSCALHSTAPNTARPTSSAS